LALQPGDKRSSSKKNVNFAALGSLSDWLFISSGSIISQVSFYLSQQGDKDICCFVFCLQPPLSSSFSALKNISQ